MVQILSLMVGKMCTSDAFVDTKTNHFSKITHLLQISNIPIPFEDWDAEKFDTIKPFKNTYKKIEREMCLSFVLTFIFTTTMMIPLAITGFFIPCSLSWININIYFSIVFNMWERHQFLRELIATKDEEDASMKTALTVLIGFSVCLLVCSILETAFYFLFNRKVMYCTFNIHS